MTRLKIRPCPCGGCHWVLTLDGAPIAAAEDPFDLLLSLTAGHG